MVYLDFEVSTPKRVVKYNKYHILKKWVIKYHSCRWRWNGDRSVSEGLEWCTATITFFGENHFRAHLPCLPLLVDFPRLEMWSENPSLSDVSLFMDGFLYISSGPAKTTLDRRGRDGGCKCRFANPRQGQSIHQSISKQFELRVCQRSTLVKRWSINQCQSVSCQTANRLIRTPNSPVKTINESVFQMCSALVLWEYLSDRSMFLEDPAVICQRKYGLN